jgi:hypothetical protein
LRYYKIDITNPANGQPVLPKSLQGLGITSLLPNGATNPGALNVELDLPIFMAATPDGQALVRIWGLGIEATGNAFNLNGMDITVFGGMSKGLPLANPAQQGILMKGTIQQAFGNWMGLDQTVDLIVGPEMGTHDEPKNIVFNWVAKTSMASAIQATLTTAFPGVQQTININPNLILNHDQVGYHYSLLEFAAVVKAFSQQIIGGDYPGVDIVYDGVTLDVHDGSSKPKPKAISFQDMLGQPTWIDFGTIQAKFVMRGDLHLNDVITLPTSLVTTSQQAFTQFQDKTTFSGNYQIIKMRHYGNYKQPDAASWNTTVNLILVPKEDSSGG